MKTRLHLLGCVFSLLLLGCTMMQAQDSPELRAFQQSAGDRSILYRGRQATRYDFPANGHPYWSATEYAAGDIECEGNLYRDVRINIDAVQQRVLVRLPSNPAAVSLSPAQVPWFTIGDQRFECVNPDSGTGLPEGIYAVYGQGPEQVYKHVSKQLQSGTNNVNGDMIGYYDEHYNPAYTRYFAISKTYWFRDAGGRFSRIRGRGALIRKFPNRKEIRRAVSAARLDIPGVTYDDFCQGVLNAAAR